MMKYILCPLNFHLWQLTHKGAAEFLAGLELLENKCAWCGKYSKQRFK